MDMSSATISALHKNNNNNNYNYLSRGGGVGTTTLIKMTSRIADNGSIRNIAARTVNASINEQRSIARAQREGILSKNRDASRQEDMRIAHEEFIDHELEREEQLAIDIELEELRRYNESLLTGPAVETSAASGGANKNENCDDDHEYHQHHHHRRNNNQEETYEDYYVGDPLKNNADAAAKTRYENNKNSCCTGSPSPMVSECRAECGDDDDDADDDDDDDFDERNNIHYNNRGKSLNTIINEEYFLEDPNELYEYHLTMQQYNQFQQQQQNFIGNDNNANNQNVHCCDRENDQQEQDQQQQRSEYFRKFRDDVEISKMKKVGQDEDEGSFASSPSSGNRQMVLGNKIFMNNNGYRNPTNNNGKNVSFLLPSSSSDYNNNARNDDDDENYLCRKNDFSRHSSAMKFNNNFSNFGFDKNGEKVVAVFAKNHVGNNQNDQDEGFCTDD